MRVVCAAPLAALLMLLCAVEIRGHGRLRVPPARTSMWRDGYNTPINYNDNELFCGGAWYQNEVNGGRCGVCGDPWGKPNPQFQGGGKYAKGIIARTYTEGQEIGIAVEITAQHGGYFEFRICPNNDFRTPVTHECLNRNLLPLADGRGYRMYLGVNDPVGFYNTTLRLPMGLSCTQCVLQWKWHTGNSWGTDQDGQSCVGCGPQEEFYGCADVEIVPLLPLSDPQAAAPRPAAARLAVVTTQAPDDKLTTTSQSPQRPAVVTTQAPDDKLTTTSQSPQRPAVVTTQAPDDKLTTTSQSPQRPAVVTTQAPVDKLTTTSQSPQRPAVVTTQAPVDKLTTTSQSPQRPAVVTTQAPVDKLTTTSQSPQRPAVVTTQAPVDKLTTTSQSPQRPAVVTTQATDDKLTTTPQHIRQQMLTTQPAEDKKPTTQERQTEFVPVQPAVPNPAGESCLAADGYAGNANMDRWCQANCPLGNCPAFLCRCGPRTTARVCKTTNVGPWKNANLDTWCARNCAAGFCPSTHCMCEMVRFRGSNVE